MEHGLQFVCCWLLHCGKSARQFLESKLFLKDTKYNIQICPCKGIQDSPEFWIPHREFPIPSNWFPFFSVELGFWTPEFQSLVEFWIPWAIFRIPKLRIPDSTSKIFRNPESGFPHMGQFKPSPTFQTVDAPVSQIPQETEKYVLLSLKFIRLLRVVFSSQQLRE